MDDNGYALSTAHLSAVHNQNIAVALHRFATGQPLHENVVSCRNCPLHSLLRRVPDLHSELLVSGVIVDARCRKGNESESKVLLDKHTADLGVVNQVKHHARNLALAMSLHPRLGLNSPLSCLGADILGYGLQHHLATTGYENMSSWSINAGSTRHALLPADVLRNMQQKVAVIEPGQDHSQLLACCVVPCFRRPVRQEGSVSLSSNHIEFRVWKFILLPAHIIRLCCETGRRDVGALLHNQNLHLVGEPYFLVALPAQR